MASGFDLTSIARRLLNMEVNTILCDAMTAEPMPAVPHALLDIATWYTDTLIGIGLDVAGFFAADSGARRSLAASWKRSAERGGAELKVSANTFDALRWAAQKANDSPEAAERLKDGRRTLLERIVNNSDVIKEMFKRFDDDFMKQFGDKTRAQLAGATIRPGSYVVSPDDLTLLQKIWDIGMDEITAQTIVYVTGDITTRVQKSLGKSGSEPIFAIHRQSIDVSINCWKALLDAVREIAGTAVGVLLGVKK